MDNGKSLNKDELVMDTKIYEYYFYTCSRITCESITSENNFNYNNNCLKRKFSTTFHLVFSI
jgi:hypothetical protein